MQIMGLLLWLEAVPWGDILVTSFFFAIGGTLGSFLNVVVHRVPRSESVVFGRSHCPACRAVIRARDNIPMLGWLLLRGRCRDCGVAIAVAYPLVELSCAIVVGLVASVEVLSGGANLPIAWAGVSNGQRGIDGLLWQTNWRLLGICLDHCFVLVTLLAWSLFERNAQPLPTNWFRATIVLAVGAAMLWPMLQPVDVLPHSPQWLLSPDWLRALIISTAGIAVGRLVGGQLDRPMVSSGLMLIGAALGWQAVVAISIALLIVVGSFFAVVGRNGPKRASQTSDLVMMTTVYLLVWRWVG